MKQILEYLIGLIVMLSVSTLCLAKAVDDSRLQVIDMQLRWHHQFQFAGYYAALEKGYYRKVGLTVRLHPAKPGLSVVEEVLNNRAHYGESNGDVLFARLRGKPIVALAAIFQHSPLVLLTRKSSGIDNPDDLIGKKVMLLNPRTDAYIHAMLRTRNIQETELELIPSSFALEDLINGKIDAFSAYITNEPFLLKRRGIDYGVIDPAEYAIDFYSDILFTTEHEVKQHPQRVAAFLQATLNGWRYAMDHPDEIIDLLLTKYKVPKSREHLQYEADVMHRLIEPDIIEIGHMNGDRWKRILKAYSDLDLTDKDISLDGFLYAPQPPLQLEQLKKTLLLVSITGVIALLVALGMLCGWIRLTNEVALHKIAEVQVKHLAYFDPLTAIHNRNSFMPYATKQLLYSQRNRQKLALCFIDLNRFKEINDNYGHKAGDAVLIHVANAITSVIRESDMAARLGGDEFVVLLTDIQDIEDTQRSIKEIQQAIAGNIAFNEHSISVTASIGVAIYPDDGEHIDDLIAKADASMFIEKKETKLAGKLFAIGL